MSSIFSAVDLSTVSTFVSTTGVVIVGVYLVYKGISIASRVINKA
jgi:hypothetical protein